MELSQPGRAPATVGTAAVTGIDAVPITVEAIVHGDGKGVQMLGSVDRTVRESIHRVLNAFRAADLPVPRGVPIVNFSPADLPKTGTAFDLPLALVLAAAGGQASRARLENVTAIGELTLDGRVLPVRGIIPISIAARQSGRRTILTAKSSALDARAVSGVDVVPIDSLSEALAYANGVGEWTPLPYVEPAAPASNRSVGDFAEIHGHETAKRALCAAAAGRHNALLVGPPGSGKSALARRTVSLLPPPELAERVDILRIRSALGISIELCDTERPFRAPHHSSSSASLLGGGTILRAGEVTRAHRGVLFLDELPEFQRAALEGLRQPLEEQRITIGRASGTMTMPADFTLLAAMNPCPCGFDGDATHACRCSAHQRRAYRARISGPLLDRFDMVVAVPTVDQALYRTPVPPEWSSAGLRARVVSARELAEQRGYGPNGRLEGEALRAAVGESRETLDTIERAVRVHRLSGRGRTRVLRLARTLADLDGSDRVRPQDIVEAAQLRCG